MAEVDTNNTHDNDKELTEDDQPEEVQEQCAEDEEDVPADFFDDFLNDDFMDGLDIVDTWDEDGQLPDSPNDKVQEENDTKNKQEESKTDSRTLRSKKENRSRERHRSTDRYKDLRDKLRRQRPQRENTPSKKDDKGNSIERSRRDPEKTRRDILKDKDKCAKDKEVKIINEKLKVVETGLVPPGMEMEVDLRELRKKQETLKQEESGKNDNAVKETSRKRSPILPMHRSERYRSRSRSGEPRRYPRRPKSRSRSRNRLPRKNSRDRPPPQRFPPSRSPRRRPRTRSRSPYFDKRYVLIREREISPRIPPKEQPREFSPRSDVSEREKWLRGRPRRSSSPRRKRSPDQRYGKRERNSRDKKTFLEEIHEKLNETSRNSPQVPQNQMMPPNFIPMAPQPVPVPQPVPIPPPVSLPAQQFMTPGPAPSQYDQQFFIGPCEVPQPVRPPMYMPQPVPMPMMQPQMGYEQPQHHQSEMFSGFQQMQLPVANSAAIEAALKKKQEEEDKKALNQLFEDKKISLSDYLSLRAKAADSRPVNLHNKINVISRCQAVVKELGGDSKLNGRFFVIKRKHSEKSPDAKFQSPLRKIPLSRLRFTTVTKTAPENNDFTKMLTKLLRSVGIHKESPPKDPESIHTTSTNQQVKERKASPKIAPSIIKTAMRRTNSNCQQKMVQTEPYKCQVCEIRASRRLVDREAQCVIKTFADASVQVAVEDFQSPLKSILKNKSLALLTPAQILAQDKGKEEVKKSIFPATVPELRPKEAVGGLLETPPLEKKLLQSQRGKPGARGFNRRRGFGVPGPRNNRAAYEPARDANNFGRPRENFGGFDRNRFADRSFEEEFISDDVELFEPQFREGNRERPFFEPPDHSGRDNRFGGGGYAGERRFW